MVGDGKLPSAAAIDEMLREGQINNFAVRISGAYFEFHKNPYGLKPDVPAPCRTWSEQVVPSEHHSEWLYVSKPELALAIACVNYTRDCFHSSTT